jgi:hypothetical protein
MASSVQRSHFHHRCPGSAAARAAACPTASHDARESTTVYSARLPRVCAASGGASAMSPGDARRAGAREAGGAELKDLHAVCAEMDARGSAAAPRRPSRPRAPRALPPVLPSRGAAARARGPRPPATVWGSATLSCRMRSLTECTELRVRGEKKQRPVEMRPCTGVRIGHARRSARGTVRGAARAEARDAVVGPGGARRKYQPRPRRRRGAPKSAPSTAEVNLRSLRAIEG